MKPFNCIFCSIIAKQVPASIVYETNALLVINDINPQAPIHYLIIPKKHIQDVRFLSAEDAQLVSDLLFAASELSKTLSEPGGFRLQINNGADAGQHVFHLHIHFLANA